MLFERGRIESDQQANGVVRGVSEVVMRSFAAREVKAGRLLRFDVEALHCAIDVAYVAEVLRAVALEPLPGAPAFVAGLINLRGVLLPVLDLRVRFGYAARRDEPSDRFVIIQVRERTVVLWVDAAVDLLTLDARAVAPSVGLTAGVRSLAGVAQTEDGILYMHDPAAFMNESEADALDRVTVVTS